MSPASALTGALLHSLWQVAVLGGLFALGRLVLRGSHARYVLGLMTLAAQLAWPAMTFWESWHLQLPVNAAPTLATSGKWWWVPAAWSLGVLVMGLRLAGALGLVRRWARDAAPLEAALAERLESLRQKLGIRSVRWGALPHLDSPLTVGFWRPMVLLPVSVLTGLSVADLELLVAHELVHVRRWDYALNVAQSVVEALLFFHPVVWWVSKRTREEREFACDDEVVKALGAPKAYARALLSLEEHRSTPLAVAATGGAFEARIRRLVFPRRGAVTLSWAVVAVLSGTFAGLLSFGLRAPPSEGVIELAPELRPALERFCGDLEATSRALEQTHRIAPEDLATVVLASVNEQTPGLDDFFVQVIQYPPAERLGTIKRSVSRALGRDWQCESLDQVWNAR